MPVRVASTDGLAVTLLARKQFKTECGLCSAGFELHTETNIGASRLI